ncbi:MAG UNVERIFIED_CONTAM: hypothetical protein LVR18_24685 [Planctomycetaceae bacterium]
MTEMAVTMRGMTGVPQTCQSNEETDEIVVLGRTPGGGVAMAMVDTRPADLRPMQVTRRTLVSDRDARTLQRQNGTLTSMTLSTADLNGDGVTEAVVAMTFRSGAAQSHDSGGNRQPAGHDQYKSEQQHPQHVAAGPSLLSDNTNMAGWWSGTSVGMLDSVATPLHAVVSLALPSAETPQTPEAKPSLGLSSPSTAQGRRQHFVLLYAPPNGSVDFLFGASPLTSPQPSILQNTGSPGSPLACTTQSPI